MKRTHRTEPMGDEELFQLLRPLAEEPVPTELITRPPYGCLPITAFAIARVDGFTRGEQEHIERCRRCGQLRDRYVSRGGLDQQVSIRRRGLRLPNSPRIARAVQLRLADIGRSVTNKPGILELLASLGVLGVFLLLFRNAVDTAKLAPWLFGALVLLYVFCAGSIDDAAPVVADTASDDELDLEESAYRRAARDCIAGRHDLAEGKLRVLADRGHLSSKYLLASLYGFSYSHELHEEARRRFMQLRGMGAQTFAVRVGLASSLLALEDHRSVDTLRGHIEHIVAVATPRDRAELHGLEVARRLLRHIQRPGDGSDDVIHGAWADVSESIRKEDGGDSATRAVARLLALAIPFDVDGASRVELLVPGDLAGTKSDRFWKRLGLITTADVPVLDPQALPSASDYPVGIVDRAAASLARHRVRPNFLGLLSLVLTAFAATLIGLQSLRLAALALVAAASLEIFDGRAAQLRANDARTALFLDYVMDRVGDVALGIGYAALFLSHNQTMFSMLALLFVAACLLVSYVRAEGIRLGLASWGGVFERPHRLAVLIAGLGLSRPAYSLIAATALTIVTVVQRVIRALWSARARKQPMRDLGIRLQSMTLQQGARGATEAR